MMRTQSDTPRLRGDIEGMRAVAILAVVLFHVNFFAPGGFVGVDVFFVISGLVITRSIVNHHRVDGRFSVGDFYVRRAKRILPALTFFLLVMVPATMLLGAAHEFPRAADTAAAAGLFVANIQLLLEGSSGYFGAIADMNPFLHMWSLSVEEQFYVAFPALVAGCLLLARRRGHTNGDDVWRQIRFVFGGVLLLSLFAMVLVAESNREAAFYLSPLRAWEFLAGAILALVPTVGGRIATTLRVVGLSLILWSVLSLDGTSGWPGPVTIVPVAGTMMVLLAAPDAGRLRRVLDNRVMRYLGGVSYSWYLWHWPAIVLGRTAFPHSTRIALVAGFAALVPAIISLRLIENPIRFSPIRRPRPVFGISLASIAAVVVVATVVTPVLNDRLPGSVTDIGTVADLYHIQRTEECGRIDTEPSEPELCGVTTDADAPRAVLLGDSVGAQFAIPFHAAAEAAGWNSAVMTMLSCAFLPGVSVLGPQGDAFPGCDEHNSDVLDALLADPPDMVAMSNDLSFALSDRHSLIPVHASENNPLPAQRSTAIADALSQVVGDLEAAGTRVVIVRRPPHSGNFSVYLCARWRWVWDNTSCGRSRLIDSSLNLRAEEDFVVDRIADRTGAIVVDSADIVCTNDCLPVQDGIWVYGDATHVTRQAAAMFTPMLEEAFAAVARDS